MSKAQQIFDATFTGPRDPRSNEYKAGCLYILRRKLDGIEQQRCPHRMPSAQADAWLAGCEEGLRLYSYERDRQRDEEAQA